MAKGDVVLIRFPFADLSGSKLRPAVVLAETTSDFTVSFITTKTSWRERTDVLLETNRNHGLKKRSLIRTNKMATLDRTLAKGRLGTLNPQETASLNQNLKLLLQLTDIGLN